MFSPIMSTIFCLTVLSVESAQTADMQDSQPSDQTHCEALATVDFSSIPDAPTQITAAELIQTGAGGQDYCQLTGYVAPQVGFLIRLPLSGWNGKFLELGWICLCG